MERNHPKYSPKAEKFNLQTVVDDSCSFFEHMEKKNEGSLEKMLVGIRDNVENGKVNVLKRYHPDPIR